MAPKHRLHQAMQSLQEARSMSVCVCQDKSDTQSHLYIVKKHIVYSL